MNIRRCLARGRLEILGLRRFHHLKLRNMSAAKRARLDAPTSEVNGELKNGYHGCKNGLEIVGQDEDKIGAGLSKREIMRLRAEHIG